MVRQTSRYAAGGRDDVDVQVPFVFAREGDLTPVGREDGVALEAHTGRESASVAAGTVNDPEIAGVRERDEFVTHRGSLEKEWRISFSASNERQQCQEQEGAAHDEPREEWGTGRVCARFWTGVMVFRREGEEFGVTFGREGCFRRFCFAILPAPTCLDIWEQIKFDIASDSGSLEIAMELVATSQSQRTGSSV